MSLAHEDRVGIDPWVQAALAGGSALLGGTAAQVLLMPFGVTGGVGFVVGAALTLLVVAGFRSVSLRASARVLVLVSALAQLRLAVLGESILSGSQGTLGWVVTSAVVLVLADRVAATSVAPMAKWTPPEDRGRLARTVGATVVVLVAFVLVVAPLLLPIVSTAAQAGQGPRLQAALDGGLNIRASDSLDMTTRPDLSDEIVFRVDANRGTFWRGQTYDVWDGRRWTQSDPQRLPLLGGTEVSHSPDDIGADGDDVVTQRFQMEVPYSEVVFAAASPVRIESQRDVLQGADGTLVTAGVPLGRDTTYTVVSRRAVLDEATLRAANGAVPEAVSARYAQPPETTQRVRDAALAATAGASTSYDKVRALERWMGDRTEYSLDAPLSPVGVDVVDHFLFTTRLGWCEQVASSLVVMARVNGLPARLVTGFVPGEVDRLTGTYVVRAREAHAWAEVWFPELGWVPFDPTASVPLAGADQVDRSVGQWLLDHAVAILVGAVVVGLLVYGGVRLARHLRRRRRMKPVGWVAETDARLGREGERLDWPRSPAETASTYAASLARHVRDDRLVQVGAAVDQALYALAGPDDAVRSEVDAILDSIGGLEPPASPHRG